jgi:hypothetical protein
VVAVGAVAVAVAVGSAHAACYSPTQIELALSTDIPCPTVAAGGGAEISVAASTEGLASEEPVTTTTACNGSSIGTLVLVPSGGRGDRVALQIALRFPGRSERCRPPDDVADCVVARRVVTFIAHRSLRLPVNLDSRCRGVSCTADQTCEQGVCVAAEVPCVDNVCSSRSEASSDASPAVDGADDVGAVDAADAELDVGPVDAQGDRSTPCKPITRHECAACGLGVRCCITPSGGYSCGPSCGQSGSDYVCDDDCQCGALKCITSFMCKGEKFCGGQCDPVE